MFRVHKTNLHYNIYPSILQHISEKKIKFCCGERGVIFPMVVNYAQ